MYYEESIKELIKRVGAEKLAKIAYSFVGNYYQCEYDYLGYDTRNETLEILKHFGLSEEDIELFNLEDMA